VTKDLNEILEGWDYEGFDRVVARKIIGLDGKEKIQLRIEMGVLQMELEGRPDGVQPRGFESLLDYYQNRLERHRRRYGSDEDFQLSREECLELQRESLQYYHRRISLLAARDFDRAAADAEHNLQILDLLKSHAVHPEDWIRSEQYRAFIMSHRTRARALASLDRGRYQEALNRLDEGINDIKEVFDGWGRGDLIENSSEIAALEHLRNEILDRKPITRRERLERELREAVEREEYETAARLRDQLRAMDVRKGSESS
jgi:tetratricopeptide (TPR) repeat protein